MKVSSTFARVAVAAIAALGVFALLGAVAIGLGVYPPMKALAAPNEALTNLPGQAKVAVGSAEGAPGAGTRFSEGGRRIATVQKLAKPMIRKATPKPKPAPVVRKSMRSVSRASATGTGWRSARVSWYGPGFYGNTMAGGGTLTRSSMVVAHRSMAFGTRIEFSYNGRTCVAVVQDRGPFIAGRTFDLGPGTAGALGFSGVGTVQYRILGR